MAEEYGNSKGWTFDALWEAFNKLRDADQTAISRATAAFEKRMDTTNEWRGALDDQAKKLATVEQVETLKGQLEKLEERVNLGSNKLAGILQLGAIIGGIITIAGGAIGVMFAMFGGH